MSKGGGRGDGENMKLKYESVVDTSQGGIGGGGEQNRKEHFYHDF